MTSTNRGGVLQAAVANLFFNHAGGRQPVRGHPLYTGPAALSLSRRQTVAALPPAILTATVNGRTSRSRTPKTTP